MYEELELAGLAGFAACATHVALKVAADRVARATVRKALNLGMITNLSIHQTRFHPRSSNPLLLCAGARLPLVTLRSRGCVAGEE
jgi:hypothetical protein